MGEICLQMRPNLIRAGLNTCVKFVSQEVLPSQTPYHFTTLHFKDCAGTLEREESHNATSLCLVLLLSIKILNGRLNLAFLGSSRLTLFYSLSTNALSPVSQNEMRPPFVQTQKEASVSFIAPLTPLL